MREMSELVDKAKKHAEDFFGFTTEVVLEFVPFEHAKEFLKEDYVAEKGSEKEWNDSRTPYTEEGVKKAMAEYMVFAWEKCQGHRGLSAGRSVEKIAAYIWLLGDDEGVEGIEAAGYAQYGAPKLAYACERYGLPMPDDEETLRMMRGEVCGEYDGCGCGS